VTTQERAALVALETIHGYADSELLWRSLGTRAQVRTLAREAIAALAALPSGGAQDEHPIYEPMGAGEREYLHSVIAAFHAVTDPEAHPDLDKLALGVLLPCDGAGHCVLSGGAEGEPVCINCHLPAGDGQWALDDTGDDVVGPFCPACWNYIVHDWPRLRAHAPSPEPSGGAAGEFRQEFDSDVQPFIAALSEQERERFEDLDSNAPGQLSHKDEAWLLGLVRQLYTEPK
jgi:hypothetical protein